MYSRCLSVLALLLLVAAAVAQDVVYDIKALNPNSGRRPPKGVQQHPNEELYDILSKIPDPSSHEDEEHHLGIFEKNGPPFKKRPGEMSIYFENVEGTFEWIYYEQYRSELSAEAASASAAGGMTDPEEFSPTIRSPSSRPLTYTRTLTSPSTTTTTSTYRPRNPIDACSAWVSLIRYCGTTQTAAESLSECYCSSDSHYVPDQWNSLAARCANTKSDCTTSDDDDYFCDLRLRASVSTTFCDTDRKTVPFYTSARSTIVRHKTSDSMGGDEYDAEGSAPSDYGDEESDQGSSNDPGTVVPDDTPARNTAMPKSTSSPDQAPSTTTSVPSHTTRRTATDSGYTLISTPDWLASALATSTSSSRSSATGLEVFVSGNVRFWMLTLCTLWLL